MTMALDPSRTGSLIGTIYLSLGQGEKRSDSDHRRTSGHSHRIQSSRLPSQGVKRIPIFFYGKHWVRIRVVRVIVKRLRGNISKVCILSGST